MVRWNDNFGKWRMERGYTTKDWNEYAAARTDQMHIFAACVGVISFLLGYFSRGV